MISFTVQRVQGAFHTAGKERNREGPGSCCSLYQILAVKLSALTMDNPLLLCGWEYPKVWIMLWLFKCRGLNSREVRDHVKLTGVGSPKLIYTYNTVKRQIDFQDLTHIKLARAKCQDPLCSAWHSRRPFPQSPGCNLQPQQGRREFCACHLPLWRKHIRCRHSFPHCLLMTNLQSIHLSPFFYGRTHNG